MTSKQLVMYVQNTGKMYKRNCLMAKGHASFQEWYDRTLCGLKIMCHECNEPHEGLSEEELQEAARQLKDYYEQHIKEV